MAPTFRKLRIEIPVAGDEDRSSSSSITLDSSSNVTTSAADDYSSSGLAEERDTATSSTHAPCSHLHGGVSADRHVRTASGSLTWMPPSPVAVKSPHASAIREKAAIANGRAKAMEFAWAEAEEEGEITDPAAAAIAARDASGASPPSRSPVKSPTFFGLKSPSFPQMKASRVARTSSGVAGAIGGGSPRGLTRTWSAVSSLPSMWRKSPRGSAEGAPQSAATFRAHPASDARQSREVITMGLRNAHATPSAAGSSGLPPPSSRRPSPQSTQPQRSGVFSRSLTSDSAARTALEREVTIGGGASDATQSFAARSDPAVSARTPLSQYLRRRAPGAAISPPAALLIAPSSGTSAPLPLPIPRGPRALVRTASAPVAARMLPSAGAPRRGLELARHGRCITIGPLADATKEAEEEEEEEEEDVPVAHPVLPASILHAANSATAANQVEWSRGSGSSSSCFPHHPFSNLRASVPSPASSQRVSPPVRIPRRASSVCLRTLEATNVPPQSHPTTLRPSAHPPSLSAPSLLPSPTIALPTRVSLSALAPCLRSPSGPSPPSSTRSLQARRVAFSPVVRVRTYSLSEEDWPQALEHATPAAAAAGSAAAAAAAAEDCPTTGTAVAAAVGGEAARVAATSSQAPGSSSCNPPSKAQLHLHSQLQRQLGLQASPPAVC